MPLPPRSFSFSSCRASHRGSGSSCLLAEKEEEKISLSDRNLENRGASGEEVAASGLTSAPRVKE
eukprot:134373-Hanusia_phi.AAC.2